MSTFTKDPDATLDYQINWADWLATGDTITASEWFTSDAAIVIESSSFTGSTATAWISGGQNRQRYRLTNRITTDNGLTNDQTLLITIAEK